MAKFSTGSCSLSPNRERRRRSSTNQSSSSLSSTSRSPWPGIFCAGSRATSSSFCSTFFSSAWWRLGGRTFRSFRCRRPAESSCRSACRGSCRDCGWILPSWRWRERFRGVPSESHRLIGRLLGSAAWTWTASESWKVFQALFLRF